MNDDLETVFNNADETIQDLILEDIIIENNGYNNQDLKRINLEDSHIEKIVTGMLNGGVRVSGSVGTISLIFGLGDDITDNVWKLILDKNHRMIKIYAELLNQPLSDDVFEYALRKYFENGEKITFDCEDGIYEFSDLQKAIYFQQPLSEQCYKLIVDYDIEYTPFLGDLPDNIKEYIIKTVNQDAINFDASKINEYGEVKKCQIIEQYPYLYPFIENPSEKVNHTLIYYKPYWIRLVEHQTERLQMESLLSKDFVSIVFKYFKNPSKKVQYQAVSQDGSIIRFINNPDYELQKIAIKDKHRCIVHIIRPHEDIMSEVLEHNWNRTMYTIAKNNINRYSEDFNHFFNKLKLKNGVPEFKGYEAKKYKRP